MELSSQVAGVLHDDHVRTMGVLDRLQGVLVQCRVDEVPDLDQFNIRMALDGLVVAVEGEIAGHFAFEEDSLFPRLTGAGECQLSEALGKEHTVILPLARRVSELARGGRTVGFTAETWREFHRCGQELIERLMSHIEKEEVGLLPLFDGVLSEEEDSDLSNQYLAER